MSKSKHGALREGRCQYCGYVLIFSKKDVVYDDEREIVNITSRIPYVECPNCKGLNVTYKCSRLVPKEKGKVEDDG